MKKTVITILLLTLMSIGMSSQVAIGIRDTQYAYASYTFKDHYALKLEHSIYSEKFGCQYLRGYAEYKSGFNDINFSISPFFGSTYNDIYWNAGALVHADYTYRRVTFTGTLNPLYDSYFGYKTCFLVGASVFVKGPLSIAADYTSIPKYRMEEKRLRGGLGFNFDNFGFQPMVSLPVDIGSNAKYIRVEFSFNYQF